MLSANRMLGSFCVSTTRKNRFASARPSMHCDMVNHSPDSPTRRRGPITPGVYCGARQSNKETDAIQNIGDTAYGPRLRGDDQLRSLRHLLLLAGKIFRRNRAL